jgi:DNA-binding NtrC family response regulator/CHASE2 domain-containing sensor protein
LENIVQKFVLKEWRWGLKIAIGLTAVLVSFISFHTIDVLKAFELQVLDFMMAFRGERAPSPEIILVTVDDQTVGELGSPLPAKYYPQVIRELNRYGAKVIVVDFLFMEPRDHDADSELIKLTEELGNVIYACHFGAFWDEGFEGESDNIRSPLDSVYAKYAVQPRIEANLDFIWADSAKFPHAIFLDSFDKAGLISVFEDPDGRFHRLPLFFKYREQIYPALSLVTFGEYLGFSLDSVRIQRNFWGSRLSMEALETIINIPINQRGQILLNFEGSFKIFKAFSVFQILKAKQDIEERRPPSISLHDFADKIVLLGNIETGNRDAFVTAFDGNFPGMAIQATAISNLLNGDALRQLPWYVDAGIILLFILAAYTGTRLSNNIFRIHEEGYNWLVFGTIILLFNLVAYFGLFKSLHIAPAMLKINSAFVLWVVSTSFYEKSLRVKILISQIQRLENEFREKLSHLDILTTRISSRDEQFKVLEFFIGEIERILNNPSVERPHPLEAPLLRLMENQKIIQERLENELHGLRSEKDRLENEKKRLELEMAFYKGLIKEDAKRSPEVPPLPQSHGQKLDEAKTALESYKAFVRKTRVSYHFAPDFGMVTAGMNSQPNGHSVKPKLQEIFEQITRFGTYDSTVLITGESGTGKELVARAIRRHSSRRNAPFVAVNITAIPEALFESELFGHKKGAFTGAIADRTGAFERANGGTIFLDEIGDLKPELQAKLLRVLQERKVQRIGDDKSIEVDVRVIAATNRDLQQLIQSREFRDDLYFRLDVANVHLPPLRERKEEVPHFVHFFLEEFFKKNGRQKRMTDEALMALILYDWPGNIRELQNLVERVCISTSDNEIRLTNLPEKIQKIYRDLLIEEEIPMWSAIESATGSEMNNLLVLCKEILLTGNVEQALQSGKLKLFGAPCENCFEYVKSFIDNKASLFPEEKRETLAKQTIVAMKETLFAWCKDEKLAKMDQLSTELEKLLGRTRRMIDNWKREVGVPAFYSPR